MTLYIIIALILVISSAIAEKYLLKKYSITRDKWIYKTVHPKQRWVEMTGALLAAILILVSIYTNINLLPAGLFMLVAVLGIRLWFEWTYDRESNKYVLTILRMGIFAGIFCAAYFTLFN
ncbi:DUF4181 domain-containing protein [Jeotgalibacillus campisalis]|uniref:DUF4181 domain-containing protein n=1 Tax=Jeotgalibacillus campisalis TaxID=220754 RepID=A0A0C2R5L9_9BACL|nr:DUF4181 domain-containing protein [Jeotgalibacillus campisalis]KIL45535.1 hypothetical protein KR50_31170 [Jeotgalibacillus campisalis]